MVANRLKMASPILLKQSKHLSNRPSEVIRSRLFVGHARA